MIEYIEEIKHFGIFQDFKAEDIQFKKINLLYGWNYSGKTTLSKIFRCLELKKVNNYYKKANFRFKSQNGFYDNNFIQETNFKVFNQDFIKDNLKFDDATAEPILLLGQKNIQIEEELLQYNEKIKFIEEEIEISNKDKNILYKDIENSLTKEAKYITDILKLGRNFDKNKLRTLLDIENINDKFLTDEAYNQYLQKAVLNEYRELIEKIHNKIEILDLEKIKYEISEVLSKQILNNKIQELTNNKELSNWIETGKNLHNGLHSCKFCEGTLSSNRLQQINNHFSKEFEELRQNINIKKSKLKIIEIDKILPVRAQFYMDLQKEFQSKEEIITNYINLYNTIINNFLNNLSDKDNRPFNIIPIYEFNNDYQNLKQVLINFDMFIENHNDRTRNFEKIKEESKTKLKHHYATKFQIDNDYFVKLEEIRKLDKLIEDNKKKIIIFQNKRDCLHKELDYATIGANKINEYLLNFFIKDDIQIKINTNHHFELMRGEYKAFNLSEGEKTAIAFAYFITKLQESNQLEDTIVYIDDPISSLDSNHLFNIYSLIKNTFYEKKEKKDIIKCKQLFISTHNLEFHTLIRDWLNKINKNNVKYFILERNKNKSILKDNSSGHFIKFNSEYSYLFSLIDEFNNNPSMSYCHFYHLPNIARRFLEIYLSFKYVTQGKDSDYYIFLFNPENDISNNKTEKVRRFVNHYSHSKSGLGINSFPNLSECKDIIENILSAIKEKEPEHFEQLKKATETCK